MNTNLEILMSESTRDYGYVITTVVINGQVYAVARREKQDHLRMKHFCPSAWEQFRFDLINEALNKFFQGESYAGY